MIFIDSSIFIAYANIRDAMHERSKAIMRDMSEGRYGQTVTSDYVFDEVITTTLVRTRDSRRAQQIGNYLLESDIGLIRIDEHIFRSSWEMFTSFRNLSFTDCTSISLIKVHRIPRIATFDRGFRGKVEVIGID